MLYLLILILAALWFFGYVSVDNLAFPNISLFTINNNVVTLLDLLILLLIVWAIGILPTPLRQIAAVILIVWVLATLGIIAFPGLASLLVLSIIIGLILTVIGVF